MNLSKKHSLFLSIAYIVTIILLLVDSYQGFGTTARLLLIDTRIIMMLYIAFSLLMRYKGYFLPKFINQINSYVILPLTTITVVAMATIENFNYPNFIFNTTHIHFDALSFVPLLSLFTVLIYNRTLFSKKYLPKVIFYSGFIVTIIVLQLSLLPRDVFVILSQEDRLIEYIQFLSLLTGSLFSILISVKLFAKYWPLALLYFIAAVVLFFVAGDEISWGQRLFSLTTPQVFLESNAQGEITIHNLVQVNKYVTYGYILVGLWGSFSWIFIPFLKKTKYSYLFIPPWFTFGYFFIGFIYNFRISLGDHFIGKWSEAAELMLYLGVAIFIITNYLRVRKVKS